MRSRVALVVFAAALALSIAGCSKKEQATQAPPASTDQSAQTAPAAQPNQAAPGTQTPAPVPPAITTAVRLPLPFWVTQYSSVPTVVGTPWMLIEVRRMAMMASPLNLPADLASETTPVTPEPAGITTLPLEAMPLASTPVKV